MTHPHPNRRFVPQAVLTKSGKINTVGASVNTAVRPVNTVGSKPTKNHPRPISNAYKKGYSQVIRPFNKYSEYKNSIFNKKVNTVRVKDTTARDRAVVSKNKGKGVNAVKASACWGNPQQKEYKEKGVIDRGCSRHVTGNKCYLTEYEDYDSGFVSFEDGKGRISGKGKIKTGSLDFDNVYFCKELKYNLFSVSQICDKKNNVLFTNTKCLVLSSDFKLLDESQVLLRVLRKDNIYSVDLKSVVLTKGLTCLFAKDTIDEFNLWHRRLGYINFKNMNKLVRGNLVRGLPSKIFENDHSCVACQKGKQHKASCKNKLMNSISKPLHMLHMDLFGPTNVKRLMKKSYCLVVTDDFRRFSWGIKREFSVARTPQQNGVAERRNRTLIEAIRTMLVDFKFPTNFWAEAVNTACYVLNRVLVIKPHNKTPYELIHGRTSLIDFMKPFGCPVTILNTRDHLGKFNGKADEGFFCWVLCGNGPDWLFDVDSLTISMNYVPVVAGNQTNGPKDSEEDSGMNPTEVDVNGGLDKDGEDDQATRSEFERLLQLEKHTNSTNSFNTAGTPVNVPNVFSIDDTGIFRNAYDDEDVGAEADCNNLETTMNVSPIPTTRIDKDHPKDQIIRDLTSAIQTRRMTKISDEHAMMDVKSAFLYGTIKEEVYVCQPLGFEDPQFPDKVYKSLVLSLKFDAQELQMSSIGEITFFLVWTLVNLPNGKRAIGTKWVFRNKKDEKGIVIRNKARLVAQAVNRIFRYLKGQPKLVLWYPRDSPFDLEAFTDSDYAGASLDWKSTTGGYQFLSKRLTSWQCKKQTIFANSTTKVEYVAAANCCGQVL
ncbi:putative ribonuclease H-like domain-containing protein [Tanacetum coccineum]